jgi:copper(I)-binding protein
MIREKPMKALPALLVALAGSTAMLVAEAGSPATLAVTSAWARATAPGAPVGAVYLVIDNPADKADRLLAVSSDRAERCEVHAMVREGDLMKMRRADPLAIGAGERVVLEPGGLHVMLMGLKSPLIDGESLHLVMTFEKAGARHVAAQVVPVTAAGPNSGHQH